MGVCSLLLIQYFSPLGKETGLLQNSFPGRSKVLQRPPSIRFFFLRASALKRGGSRGRENLEWAPRRVDPEIMT